LNPADEHSEQIDNCQHVLLRCFTNLLDFYERTGVKEKIHFHDRLHFVRPGGAVDILKPGWLPAPAHLIGSLLMFRGLTLTDKYSILTALAAMRHERQNPRLDNITIAHWLTTHGATEKAVSYFWRPILISALNEELERVSARPAFHVFLQGVMKNRASYQIGIPAVPLSELYPLELDNRLGENVRVHLRSSIKHIDPTDRVADYYVSAVPFEYINQLIPSLQLPLERFEHSPITGIHLWFDREITTLPHAVLLNRTIQWVFRKSANYFQCVVSSSRSLLPLSREKIIAMACCELGEFFPVALDARLIKAHVVKETRATYSSTPGLEVYRPLPTTKYPNLFLAGDWTQTGWPATMEGAVRSGYQAAEAIARATGREESFVLP